MIWISLSIIITNVSILILNFSILKLRDKVRMNYTLLEILRVRYENKFNELEEKKDVKENI